MNFIRNPFFYLPLAAVCLFAALIGGLERMGALRPGNSTTDLAALHGPLMAAGFLGALIALERAAGSRKARAYLGPLFSGVGGLLTFVLPEEIYGRFLLMVGAMVMSGVFVFLMQIRRDLSITMLFAGSLFLVAGNFRFLLNHPPAEIIFFWQGFLLLTIAGERMELSAFRMNSLTSRTFLIAGISIFAAGALIHFFRYPYGSRFAGAGYLLLAIWLLRFDMAGRTIRIPGLPRYTASALITGYFWLMISGLIFLLTEFRPAGLMYDAALHSFFLGFVFSMIFAHGPIIFPAILKYEISYRKFFYFPVVLLHISTLLRITGDFTRNVLSVRTGGILGAIAILSFIAAMAAGAILNQKRVRQNRSVSNENV